MNSVKFYDQLKILWWKNCLQKQRCMLAAILSSLLLLFALVSILIAQTLCNGATPFDTNMLPVNSSLYSQELSVQYLCATPKNNDVEKTADSIVNFFQKVKWKTVHFSIFNSLCDSSVFQNFKCDAIIEFNSDLRRNGSYVLRLPRDKIPSRYSEPSRGECLSNAYFTHECSSMSYLSNDFSLLQLAVDSALIKLWSKDKEFQIPDPRIIFYRNNTFPPVVRRPVYGLQLFIAFGFCFTMGTLCHHISKEMKIKKFLGCVGMKSLVYWLSLFTTEMIVVAVANTLPIILMYGTRVIVHANALIFYFLFFLYGNSLTIVSFLISSLFRKLQGVYAVSGFVILVISLIPYAMDSEMENQLISPVYYGLALLSPFAFGRGLFKVFEEEFNGGMTFSKLFEGKFSLGACMFMLILDTMLYFFLLYFLDIFFHNGIHFSAKAKCLLQSLWISSIYPKTFKNGVNVDPIHSEQNEKLTIRLCDVTKIFHANSGTKITALNRINLTLHDGKITALLGCSGAGKTTLVKILSGDMILNRGKILVNDINITKKEFLSMVGVCSHHNTIYKDLTTRENLIFFGRMKGLIGEQLNDAVEKVFKDMDLDPQNEVLCFSLNSNQKRKLCVAIAMLGNPKILLLDEPNAKMDIEAKQELWKVLNTYKEKRIVLFTTHCEKEAESFADEIAIIHEGNLLCAGTLTYLQKQFGFLYHLRIASDSADHQLDVIKAVCSHYENASYTHHYPRELQFAFPVENVKDFSVIIQAAENSCNNGSKDILKYGFLSTLTLQAIFCRAVEEKEIQIHESNFESIDEVVKPVLHDRSKWNSVSHEHKKFSLHIYLVMQKLRFILWLRQPFKTILVLIVFTLFAVTTVLLIPNDEKDFIPTEFSPDLYAKASFYLRNQTDHDLREIEDAIEEGGLVAQVYSCCLDNTSLGNSYMGVIVKNYFTAPKNEISVEWEWIFSSANVHSLPILQNIMSNAVWKTVSNFDSRKLSISYRPFPFYSADAKFVDHDLHVYSIFYFSSFILLIVPILSIEALKEKRDKKKYQQLISGVDSCMYWWCMLVTHSTILILGLILMAVTIDFCNLKLFPDPHATHIFLVLLFLFVPVSLLSDYTMSFFFFSFPVPPFTFSATGLITSTLSLFLITIFEAYSINQSFLHLLLCLIFPYYIPVGAAYFLIKKCSFLQQKLYVEMETHTLDYWQWDSNILTSFICLFWHMFSCSILLMLTDFLKRGGKFSNSFPFFNIVVKRYKMRFCDEEGNVIKNDELHIQNPEELLLLVKTHYPRNGSPVIKNLCLSVNSGEIFGLLGPSESGKTSIMRIIVGQEKLTAGHVFVKIGNEEYNANSHISHIRYCPQHGSFWELMTLEEHLHFYAAIKGLPSNQITSVCNSMMNYFNVKQHARKRISELSSISKSKLTYMIGIMGSSKIVLLDEPTAGMDSYSTKLVWNHILSYISHSGKHCALLTTQSPNEADALCTEIGIMDSGTLKCSGSSKSLKDKYGGSYFLKFNTSNTNKRNEKKVKKLDAFVGKVFPGSSFSHYEKSWVIYNIPQDACFSHARISESLEKAKLEIKFLDYTFSQTTINEVYSKLARERI